MLVQMPAPGGLVTKVRETTYPNGVSQQAILEGGGGVFGENHLEISVLTGQAGGAGMLSMGPPSQDSIRREIVARYPKFEMRIVTQPRQNALGVFGLAIGRAAGGGRCIFAWQWVDDIRNPGRKSSGSFFSSKFTGEAGATPASIRIHLCRKDATVDDLAATVEGLTLASPSVVERALDPRRATPTVSARSGQTQVAAAASNIPDGSLESALGPAKNVAVADADNRGRAGRASRVAGARRRAVEPDDRREHAAGDHGRAGLFERAALSRAGRGPARADAAAGLCESCADGGGRAANLRPRSEPAGGGLSRSELPRKLTNRRRRGMESRRA